MYTQRFSDAVVLAHNSSQHIWLKFSSSLSHLSLASFYGILANSAEPDQMPQNATSDQVIQIVLLN